MIRFFMYFAVLLCIHSFELVNAGNAFLPTDTGRHQAMGGSGVALPTDASNANVNPALIVRLCNEVYGGPGILYINQKINTSDAIISTFESGQQNHQIWNPVAILAVNYHLCPNLSIGVSTTAGGAGLRTYKHLTLADNDEFNNRSKFFAFAFSTSISWQPCCNQAYGASLVTGISQFKSNGATLAGTETRGKNVTSTVYGIGARVGALWDITPCLTFGASVTTPIWFENFGRYRDLVKYSTDLPATVVAGIAWYYTPCTVFTFDLKELFWSDVKAFGRKPENGGLDWKNQFVVAVGVQHQLNCDWTLRFGYNYGKNPIRGRSTLFNAAIQGIGEHTLAGGFTYRMCRTLELDVYGEYQFKNKITDHGNGLLGELSKGIYFDMYYSSLFINFKWYFGG